MGSKVLSLDYPTMSVVGSSFLLCVCVCVICLAEDLLKKGFRVGLVALALGNGRLLIFSNGEIQGIH